MTEARTLGRKIGVLLVNKRLEVPSSFPDRDSLQQITLAPEIREIVPEGDYWRISGLLNACITYKREKRVSSAQEVDQAEMGELSGFLEEKTFFDDGFSDHDEFAEEGARLLEGDWEEGNPREDSISYLQPVEFTGITPRSADFIPSNKPKVSIVDVENKTPGEHIVDIGAILVFEDEAVPQVAEQAWGEGVEFIQPLALTSWPPGMAEVVEWQVGYPEWRVMIKDREALVSTNLILQVIGTEKEGEEREFTAISTQCPIQLAIPLDLSKPSNTVSGVKVEILEVREDPVGLAIRGQVLIDRIEELPPVEEEIREAELLPEAADSILEAEPIVDAEPIQDVDFLQDVDILQGVETQQEVEPIPDAELIEEAEFQLEGTYSGDMDPDAHDILLHVDQLVNEIPELEEMLNPTPESLAETVSQDLPSDSGEVKLRLSYSNSGNSPKMPQVKNQEPPIFDTGEQFKPVPGSPKKIARGKGRTNWKLYLVKTEDTLESICQSYGISQEDFRAKNKLGTQVEPGQYLWITR